MEFDKVLDSGAREQMNTGSQRDTREGKGRYDLLPTFALARIARHFENGAKKYGDHNWQLGQALSRFLDSGIRHAFAYLQGQADEDHLAAAAWNLLAALDTEERISKGLLPSALDDLPGNPSGVRNPSADKILTELRFRLSESGYKANPKLDVNPEFIAKAPLYDHSTEVGFITNPDVFTPVSIEPMPVASQGEHGESPRVFVSEFETEAVREEKEEVKSWNAALMACGCNSCVNILDAWNKKARADERK